MMVKIKFAYCLKSAFIVNISKISLFTLFSNPIYQSLQQKYFIVHNDQDTKKVAHSILNYVIKKGNCVISLEGDLGCLW